MFCERRIHAAGSGIGSGMILLKEAREQHNLYQTMSTAQASWQSRDQQGLSKDKWICLIGGDNTDVEISFDTKKASDLRLEGFDKCDIPVSSSPL